MTSQIVGRPENRQCAITEELVHMPTGIHHRRHHNLEHRIEPGHRVLSSIGLRERREITDIDKQHRHLTALTGEDIVTLLQQPRRQPRIDIRAERRLKTLPLSQTRLHPIERRRQRPQIIILNHRQPPTVITSPNPLSPLGKVPNRYKRGREHGANRGWHREENREAACDYDG